MQPFMLFGDYLINLVNVLYFSKDETGDIVAHFATTKRKGDPASLTLPKDKAADFFTAMGSPDFVGLGRST